MKICILGPVTTNRYWGGVASFDEGLAEAFLEKGFDTTIVSVQYREKPSKTNVPIKLVKGYCVEATIKSMKPDVVIASLNYGKYFCGITGVKKIYFLHGFFNIASYGIAKTLMAVCYQRWMCSLADEVVSNSYFTSALNEKFWNIKSDNVAWLGADSEYINHVRENSVIKNAGNGKVLFAGRLVKGKGVDTIIRAFSRLDLEMCEKEPLLVIAGDGSLKSELEEIVRDENVKVRFLGKVDHSEMYKRYRDTEIFISLNETEPFGITYVEALLSGCKIICPKTGGQVEFLCDYPDRVRFVDAHNEEEIGIAIEEMLGRKLNPLNCNQLISKFNYVRTANILLGLQKNEKI